MKKELLYRNFKHTMPNVEFLQRIVQESFLMPIDMIEVSLNLTNANLEQIFKDKLSIVKTIQDKSSSNYNKIQIKPQIGDDVTILEIPVYFKNFVSQEQIQQQLLEGLRPKQKSTSENLVKEIFDFHNFHIQIEAPDKANIHHSFFKSQIKVSVIDFNFQFVNTDHLQKVLINTSSKMSQGLLGFDENFRIVVYDQKSTYPVVGLWTKGLELGNIFLKNQINDKLRQLLWIILMKHARSETFNKVTFADKKIKFIFVPFSSKGSNPPILLVEMGSLLDQVTHEVIKIGQSHQIGVAQIEESILIQQSLQVTNQSLQVTKQTKRTSNFKLWDNFLTKTSLPIDKIIPPRMDLNVIEDRIEKLTLEFERIEKEIQENLKKDNNLLKIKVFNTSGQFLEEDYLKSESDVQNSNYPHQFQRLLQQQSSRQLFTGRSLQSNQKNTCAKLNPNEELFLLSKKDTQTKFSPQKKLKNSIYETLNQTNKWLSSEGKKLSIGQLSQQDVNSFFADIPQIKTCQ